MPIITDALNRIRLNHVDLKDVLFLTGNGISAPNPTSFFLGREAHAAILENFTTLSATERSQVLAGIPFEKSCDAIQRTFQGHPAGAFVNVPSSGNKRRAMGRGNATGPFQSRAHTLVVEQLREMIRCLIARRVPANGCGPRKM
jgi:hypothetical protein